MLGFLIAAAAGFLTPQLEGPVAGPIVRFLENHMSIAAFEKRLIAFMAALLGAAVLAALLDTGSALGVVIGSVIGYFGSRIFELLKKIIDERQSGD